jgi:hypothetical protein
MRLKSLFFGLALCLALLSHASSAEGRAAFEKLFEDKASGVKTIDLAWPKLFVMRVTATRSRGSSTVSVGR